MTAAPILISSLSKTPAQRLTYPTLVSFSAPPYDEDWMQNLIHANPDLLPCREVEPCFDGLVAIAREVGLPSGYLDNLYVTRDGYPVLVECKLWKNQEQRRKVVAQIVEYAKDVSQMPYAELNRRICDVLKRTSDNILYTLVSEQTGGGVDEAEFTDRVCANLKSGRFLLLIVGDGMRHELSSLAEYMIGHSLRYAFGLVELRAYAIPDTDQHIVVPNIVARTQTIERHVTVVQTGGVIDAAPDKMKTTTTTESRIVTTPSLDAFLERLKVANPQSHGWLLALMDKLDGLPVELVAGGNRGDYVTLVAKLTSGETLSLIRFNLQRIEWWAINWRLYKDTAWVDLLQTYFSDTVRVLPGTAIKEWESGFKDIRLEGKTKNDFVPHAQAYGHETELVGVIRRFLSSLESYVAAQ